MLGAVQQRMIGGSVLATEIAGDVLDIGHRINAGDPTIGWRGDSRMSLHAGYLTDELTGRPILDRFIYEVHGFDAHDDPYVVGRWPECDTRILRDLAAGDWRNPDRFDLLRKKNAAAQARRERVEAEARGEAVDRLAWALQRDQGYLYGGLSRDTFNVGGHR
jgi:hypothetical protein